MSKAASISADGETDECIGDKKIQVEKWQLGVGVVGTMVAVVLGAMQIFDWWNQHSGPHVTAVAEVNRFSLPNSGAGSPVRFALPGISDEWGEEDIQRMLRYCREYTTVSMVNKGDMRAEEVELQVGADGLVFIDWGDGTSKLAPFKSDISIGSLPIDKQVNLSLWSERTFGDGAEGMQVIHKTGKSPVIIAGSSQRPGWVTALAAAWISVGILFVAVFTTTRRLKVVRDDYHEHLKRERFRWEVLRNLKNGDPPLAAEFRAAATIHEGMEPEQS